MSQLAESSQRLELYKELDDVVTAMKNLAQVELHRVTKLEEVQQGAYDTAVKAFAMVQQFQRSTDDEYSNETHQQDGKHAILLIGSERGFCGGFNEQIVRVWQEKSKSGNEELWVIGNRLAGKLRDAELDQLFPSPSTADEILTCVHQVLDNLLRSNQPLASLTVLSHSDSELKWRKLIPEPDLPDMDLPTSMILQVPTSILLVELRWQFLQQALCHLLAVSLRIENHHRLQQMEGAREHLESLSHSLKLKINSLRQQQIVEEIEVILADQEGAW